jgi:tRNA (mo5U34)-methyltransferase
MPARATPAATQFARRTRADLLAMAARMNWVHAIDLGGGVVTPGLWGRGNPIIEQALREIDWRGKKILDIGCWDGMYSFLAESLGAAAIYATDLVNQRDYADQPTFDVARTLRNSQALYYPNMSVYDVESIGVRDFDVIIFAGVYYHLKDPVRALTTLRRLLKPGGQILVEGAILEEPGCFAKFYYRDLFCGDRSNWWVPTVDCLKQWVECSFFQIKSMNAGVIWKTSGTSSSPGRWSGKIPSIPWCQRICANTAALTKR